MYVLVNSGIFYKQTATITRDRLGATAERFITRQIRSHLQKDPETLQPKDLEQLIDWIELATRTIYANQQVIDAYIHDLQALIATTKNHPGHDQKT